VRLLFLPRSDLDTKYQKKVSDGRDRAVISVARIGVEQRQQRCRFLSILTIRLISN
jgi:hypothetical protein